MSLSPDCPRCDYCLSYEPEEFGEGLWNCGFCGRSFSTEEVVETIPEDEALAATCPSCREDVQVIPLGDGFYLCVECGWAMDASGQDLENLSMQTRRANCPNGCGPVDFAVDRHYWRCPECGLPFFEHEIEGSEEEPLVFFGACPVCEVVVPWRAEEDGTYPCPLCTSVSELDVCVAPDQMVMDPIIRFNGEKTGCIVCGAEAPEGAAPVVQCECGIWYLSYDNYGAQCPHCSTTSNPRVNTFALGEPSSKHHFYCFDCERSFTIDFETCPTCEEEDCKLSSFSIYGELFTCPKCHDTFRRDESLSNFSHRRTTRASSNYYSHAGYYSGDWDDEYWDWGSSGRTLEQKLETLCFVSQEV